MDFFEKLQNSETPYIIAEGADAHYGSLTRAKQMIDRAKLSGADAIKFQHHFPDEEMLPDVPMSGNMQEPLYDFLKKNALDIGQHVELFEYATGVGIQYLCTPFSWKAAQELENAIDLPVFKIGSGEMTDLPTLEKISSLGKPMIVSTGMSEVHEIDVTYQFLIDRGVKLVLMNCTSAYPPIYSDLHLGFITSMQARYPKAIIGHSDHTNEIYSSLVAVGLGAKVIEKHVTIDEHLPGPDASVSLNFDDLSELVRASKLIYSARSSEKYIHENEKEIVEWARRSIVTTHQLSKGHVISEQDIWGKRPGTGIPSSYFWDLIGKKTTRDVAKNVLLSVDDIEGFEF
jgi:N-acetylneuraminate synthase